MRGATDAGYRVISRGIAKTNPNFGLSTKDRTPDSDEDNDLHCNWKNNVNKNPQKNIFFCRALTTVPPRQTQCIEDARESAKCSRKNGPAAKITPEFMENARNGVFELGSSSELLDLVEGLKRIAECPLPASAFEWPKFEPFSAAKLWREARIEAKESYAKKMAQPEMQKFMLGINKIIQTRWPCELEEGEREGIDAAIDISSKYGHLTPAARALLGQDGPLVCCADVQESKQNRHEVHGTEQTSKQNQKVCETKQNAIPILEFSNQKHAKIFTHNNINSEDPPDRLHDDHPKTPKVPEIKMSQSEPTMHKKRTRSLSPHMPKFAVAVGRGNQIKSRLRHPLPVVEEEDTLKTLCAQREESEPATAIQKSLVVVAESASVAVDGEIAGENFVQCNPAFELMPQAPPDALTKITDLCLFLMQGQVRCVELLKSEANQNDAIEGLIGTLEDLQTEIELSRVRLTKDFSHAAAAGLLFADMRKVLEQLLNVINRLIGRGAYQ